MGHIWSLISILLWCVHVRLHGMQKTCDVTIYIMSIFIVLYDRYDAMQWYLVTQGNRESWAKCAPSTCIARTLYLWEVEDWVKSGRVMRSVSQAHPHNHRHPDHQYSSIFVYDSFSDVGEIRVYFASKILTPCRIHWNAFLIAQIIAKCHSFPNM